MGKHTTSRLGPGSYSSFTRFRFGYFKFVFCIILVRHCWLTTLSTSWFHSTFYEGHKQAIWPVAIENEMGNTSFSYQATASVSLAGCTIRSAKIAKIRTIRSAKIAKIAWKIAWAWAMKVWMKGSGISWRTSLNGDPARQWLENWSSYSHSDTCRLMMCESQGVKHANSQKVDFWQQMVKLLVPLFHSQLQRTHIEFIRVQINLNRNLKIFIVEPSAWPEASWYPFSQCHNVHFLDAGTLIGDPAGHAYVCEKAPNCRKPGRVSWHGWMNTHAWMHAHAWMETCMNEYTCDYAHFSLSVNICLIILNSTSITLMGARFNNTSISLWQPKLHALSQDCEQWCTGALDHDSWTYNRSAQNAMT